MGEYWWQSMHKFWLVWVIMLFWYCWFCYTVYLNYCICDKGDIKWVIMEYSNSILLCYLENQDSQHKEKILVSTETNGKRNVVYTKNGIVLSHWKSEILPFATTWYDLDGIMPSKIINLKNKTNQWIWQQQQQKNRFTYRESTTTGKGDQGGQDRRRWLRGTNYYI